MRITTWTRQLRSSTRTKIQIKLVHPPEATLRCFRRFFALCARATFTA
jgi:hypothetical protein